VVLAVVLAPYPPTGVLLRRRSVGIGVFDELLVPLFCPLFWPLLFLRVLVPNGEKFEGLLSSPGFVGVDVLRKKNQNAIAANNRTIMKAIII